MSKKIEHKFDQADTAVEQTVTAFMDRVDRLMMRWECVSPDYVLERTLLELAEQLAKRIDEPHSCPHGPATIRPSNALADYRDSRGEERG